MVRILLKQKMKIGPKGQIVIPKPIRDGEKLYVGREVFVEWTDEGIRIDPVLKEDPLKVFERISKKKPKRKFDFLHGYEKELEQRWKKSQASI